MEGKNPGFDYLEYFINKDYNLEYQLSQPYTGNVGEFKDQSRLQLVQQFKADKFYQLNSQQKMQLFQAVVNDYCKASGVSSCAIELADLPISDKTVCYGEFLPAQSKILINKEIFELIDDAKYCKNQYLPMQLLSTIIHEAQHRVQFETLENPNKSEREKIVAQSIQSAKKFSSYNKYLVEPEELDAREKSIEYIKECARELDDITLQKYCNTLILKEHQNCKSATSPEIQQHFYNIYGKYPIKPGHNLNKSEIEFKSMLMAKQQEKE